MTSPRHPAPAGTVVPASKAAPEEASPSRVGTLDAGMPATLPGPHRRGAFARPVLDGPAPTAEQVFLEHAPRIFAVALRVVGNEADAEDVTQEVLLLVVRKLDTFRGDAALSTWLHRVTVNAALALRRRRAASREYCLGEALGQFLADGSHAGPVRPWRAPPDEQAAGRELRGLIEAAIAGLPLLYRATYVLADVEGLSNAEVGAALGLSLPAVKSRLHRARLLMRAALAPHLEARDA
jgi:RNA polymerase sigma-70 factor, ECF subfamily